MARDTQQTSAKHRAPATGNPFLPLILDVAVPLASYYLMRHFGVSLVMALAISGTVPAVRVVWSTIRERTADGLALAVLVLTLVGIPVAFLTGTPKLLLAKDSVGTGVFGCWLLSSAFLGRPAMANGMRAFLARTEGSALAWEQLSANSAEFRANLRAATLVWGVGFVVECVARIVTVVLLPVQTAVWAVNIPIAIVITGCIVVQTRWARRLAIQVYQRVAENDRSATRLTLATAA